MDYYPDSNASLIFPPAASTLKQAFGFTRLSTTLTWYQRHVAEVLTLQEARIYRQGRTPSRTFAEQMWVLHDPCEALPLGYVFCQCSADLWALAKKNREVVRVHRCEAGDPRWLDVSRVVTDGVHSEHKRLQMLVQGRIRREGQPARA